MIITLNPKPGDHQRLEARTAICAYFCPGACMGAGLELANYGGSYMGLYRDYRGYIRDYIGMTRVFSRDDGGYVGVI